MALEWESLLHEIFDETKKLGFLPESFPLPEIGDGESYRCSPPVNLILVKKDEQNFTYGFFSLGHEVGHIIYDSIHYPFFSSEDAKVSITKLMKTNLPKGCGTIKAIPSDANICRLEEIELSKCSFAFARYVHNDYGAFPCVTLERDEHPDVYSGEVLEINDVYGNLYIIKTHEEIREQENRNGIKKDWFFIGGYDKRPISWEEAVGVSKHCFYDEDLSKKIHNLPLIRFSSSYFSITEWDDKQGEHLSASSGIDRSAIRPLRRVSRSISEENPEAKNYLNSLIRMIKEVSIVDKSWRRSYALKCGRYIQGLCEFFAYVISKERLGLTEKTAADSAVNKEDGEMFRRFLSLGKKYGETTVLRAAFNCEKFSELKGTLKQYHLE